MECLADRLPVVQMTAAVGVYYRTTYWAAEGASCGWRHSGRGGNQPAHAGDVGDGDPQQTSFTRVCLIACFTGAPPAVCQASNKDVIAAFTKFWGLLLSAGYDSWQEYLLDQVGTELCIEPGQGRQGRYCPLQAVVWLQPSLCWSCSSPQQKIPRSMYMLSNRWGSGLLCP
jgi:hypothetical protein